MSTPNAGMDGLPYLDEYLQLVLRPKVEAAVRQCAETLAEDAWERVVEMIAQDGRAGANGLSPAAVRSLIEDRLRLRLAVSLEALFGDDDESAVSAEATAAGSARDNAPSNGHPSNGHAPNGHAPAAPAPQASVNGTNGTASPSRSGDAVVAEGEVVDGSARRRAPMNPLANAVLGTMRRPGAR